MTYPEQRKPASISTLEEIRERINDEHARIINEDDRSASAYEYRRELQEMNNACGELEKGIIPSMKLCTMREILQAIRDAYAQHRRLRLPAGAPAHGVIIYERRARGMASNIYRAEYLMRTIDGFNL